MGTGPCIEPWPVPVPKVIKLKKNNMLYKNCMDSVFCWYQYCGFNSQIIALSLNVLSAHSIYVCKVPGDTWYVENAGVVILKNQKELMADSFKEDTCP